MLRAFRRAAGSARFAVQNRRRIATLKTQRGLRVHLGCGDEKIATFVNVDTRRTPAADVVMDLSLPQLAAGSVALAFSHAFFEHLYRSAQLPHLRCVFDALEPIGACCYIGIPYFPNIARFYLERAPGIVGPVFDLYNVYRYTHGDPEQPGATGWWLEQLHKSLFDEEEVTTLLRATGFRSFAEFCYVYPGEELPVSIGFYASRDARSQERLREDCLTLLRQFDGKKILLRTLRWLDKTGE